MESKIRTYKPKQGNENKLKVYLKKIEDVKQHRVGSSSRK